MPNAASPPTTRVLDVLELLAQRGQSGPAPRLGDLVRDLGLTQATAHAIMATLCERGWAVRDPDHRTFTLGPALAAVAARAAAERSRHQPARAAVHRLAKDLGYPAVMTERVGDELVITTIDLGACQVADAAAGDRFPFAAPLGVVFAAWENSDGRRAWMDRGAITDPVLAERLDGLLTATRERGHTLERLDPAMAQAARAMASLRADPQAQPVRRAMDGVLAEIARLGLPSTGATDQDRRPVTAIAAPVFDPHTRQATASIGVHPLRALSARRADEIANHVTRATAAVNAAFDDDGRPASLDR
ncbi:DNA-binding transcriptional regulator, IclR family [Parafrankia irregularis]|uniref:DNA-binding transcriptional regulator, IclR family n=1 Tax=Parafrankia irregularis TaxID=795642 RepID=A0A0S4QMH1_9ACTN|nr:MULTISPECIES: helix-turn-helix domain-containing protein [Parafrankia]MBE3200133.1 helix-turn-helix domain-containing protein [Parafrankia sp. CH37]CUU56675.1 DNA-binding transcriptional regulator, IclR family [Parafrankia irregularis]